MLSGVKQNWDFALENLRMSAQTSKLPSPEQLHLLLKLARGKAVIVDQ